MSELISEADAHVARTPDDLVDAALEAAELACRAAVHSLEAIRLMRTGVAPVGRRIPIQPMTVDVDWVAPGGLATDPRTAAITDDVEDAPVDVVVHATLCGGDCAIVAGPDGPRCGWEPDEEREDRWVGTGEPVVEAPPAPAVEGAMPPDHCGKHREHRPDCRACIVAMEAADAWRDAFQERAAAARAAVAAEAAAGPKPLSRGRAEFRAAKASFDAGRQPASQDQKTAITVMLDKRGVTDRDAVIDAISGALGRRIESRNDLTRAEASTVIDRLSDVPPPPDPALPDADQDRPVAPVDAAVAPSVEHPADPTRVCGMCGHDHHDTCIAGVVVADGEEEPCGCPAFTEPDFGEPDDEPRSDVQGEHVDPTPPPVGRDDGAPDDAADGFTPDGWDRVDDPKDDRDEFDRARPGWREYDADHQPVLATGGTDEPIF